MRITGAANTQEPERYQLLNQASKRFMTILEEAADEQPFSFEPCKRKNETQLFQELVKAVEFSHLRGCQYLMIVIPGLKIEHTLVLRILCKY